MSPKYVRVVINTVGLSNITQWSTQLVGNISLLNVLLEAFIKFRSCVNDG